MSDLFEKFSSDQAPEQNSNDSFINLEDSTLSEIKEPLPTLDAQVAQEAVAAADLSELPDLTVYKKQLKKLGAFTLILFLSMGLLILAILLSRKSWEQGLQEQVSLILQEEESPYSVNIMEKYKTSFSLSFASFSLLKDNRLAFGVHAVLIRVTGLYGPNVALYIYDENTGLAEFKQFVALHGKANAAIVSVSLNSQIAYWKNRIPLIFSSTQEDL